LQGKILFKFFGKGIQEDNILLKSIPFLSGREKTRSFPWCNRLGVQHTIILHRSTFTTGTFAVHLLPGLNVRTKHYINKPKCLANMQSKEKLFKSE